VWSIAWGRRPIFAAFEIEHRPGNFTLRMCGVGAEEQVHADRHRRPAPFGPLLVLHGEGNANGGAAATHFFFLVAALPLLPPPPRSEFPVGLPPPVSRFFEPFAGAFFFVAIRVLQSVPNSADSASKALAPLLAGEVSSWQHNASG
jgi:hypothetical protein